MTKKESNERVSPSHNAKAILIDEVDAICPICTRTLYEEKNSKFIVVHDFAHIYPLNPTANEIIILKDVKKLSNDVNHINNFIALCKSCHKIYDTNKTLEEYNILYNLKKKLIAKRELKTKFIDYKIENEVKEIIDILDDEDYVLDNETKFEYTLKVIDDKLKKSTLSLRKDIKSNVKDYYSVIKSKLVEIEKLKISQSEKISLEFKLYYLELKDKTELSQEDVFEEMINWLEKKTKKSRNGCKIVVSFFIQNCEVFE